MMKRFINILIAGLFLFTTTGFTITKHYCGNNLVSVAINATPHSCGMNGDCCHNEGKLYQLKEDVTFTPTINADHEFSFNIQLFFNELQEVSPKLGFISNADLKYEFPPPNLSVFLAEIQSFRL